MEAIKTHYRGEKIEPMVEQGNSKLKNGSTEDESRKLKKKQKTMQKLQPHPYSRKHTLILGNIVWLN